MQQHLFTRFKDLQHSLYRGDPKENWENFISNEIASGNKDLLLEIQDFSHNINCKGWDFSNVDLTQASRIN